MTVYLTTDSIFWEKGRRGDKAVPVGKDNVVFEQLNDSETENVWFSRDYQALIDEQAKRRQLSIEETILIYGEISFPTYGEPLANQKFIYNEQLGLKKDTQK